MSDSRTPAQNRTYLVQKLSHLERGDLIVPPPERADDELDRVVEGLIDALPAASRLYPDRYAWIVADAVREHLARLSARPSPEDGAPDDRPGENPA